MANYTADQGIAWARAFVKNVITTDVQLIACDLAIKKIWMAYPWRWTLGSLTSIALVDGTQDYSLGDADFYRPVNLWITRTDLTPDEYKELLIFEHHVPRLSAKVGWPNFQSISWEKSINQLRLEAAAEVPSGVTLQIDGDYQKIPTTLTATTGSLLQDDIYFDVFCAWLLFYFYKFSDDSRMGAQFQEATLALEKMKEAEGAGNGVPLVYPDEPLVGSGRW